MALEDVQAELMDPEFATDVAMVFGGFMGAATVDAATKRTGIESDFVGIGVGLGVAAAGINFDQHQLALGGGAYAAMDAARLSGVRDTVLSAAAGGS